MKIKVLRLNDIPEIDDIQELWETLSENSLIKL